MPVDSKTQGRPKKSGDTNKKGPKDKKALSANSSGTIPRSSNGKWDDGVRTMREVQKNDDAADRKANGVNGVLGYAAKDGMVSKKQK